MLRNNWESLGEALGRAGDASASSVFAAEGSRTWNDLRTGTMLGGRGEDLRGQSVLVIDKNVENLTAIADRHYIIERGRAVWSGTSEQLVAEPDLQHRYLGI